MVWLIVSILFLSIVSSLAIAYKEIAVSKISKKTKTSILIVLIASILSLVLTSYKEWKSEKETDEYRQKLQSLVILESILKYRVEMWDSYLFLVSKSSIIDNYVAYENGRQHDKYGLVLPWKKQVTENLKNELEIAQSKFERLQKISREILIQSETYNNVIPDAMIQWAVKTLNLKFEDLPTIIILSSESKDAEEYAKLMGQAIGLITRQAIDISTKILN